MAPALQASTGLTVCEVRSLVAGDGLGAVLRGQLPDLQVRVLAAADQAVGPLQKRQPGHLQPSAAIDSITTAKPSVPATSRVNSMLLSVGMRHASDRIQQNSRLVVMAAQAEHAGLAHHVPDDDIRVLGAGRQQRSR